MTRALLASTSTLYNNEYLSYLLPEVKKLFEGRDEILFIPYARPGGISYENYSRLAASAFKKINIRLRGIQEFKDPVEAIKEAQGIFTGGGNTFLLVSSLYRNKLIQVLRDVILNGTPYLGTSAGANIAGLTIQTTNDMPIVYPPSFKTLTIVPFNINPHYLDADNNSQHQGETREMRILEFHSINTQPVVGIREGSWLEIANNKIRLKGEFPARIFKAYQVPYEIESESFLNDLK